jgi:murein DD-endopeptidase MepM/ murein hydrolase activator NlpD
MSAKIFSLVVAVSVGAVVVCTAGLGLVGGRAAACTGRGAVDAAPRVWAPAGAYVGVPTRGLIIAVAVAIQESSLRNRTDGPDDSLGLFQQRPSQGWGTREQLMDPVYAAKRFYTALLAVAGWQQMPLTVAGQAVQRSAYPDAYAQWEPDATMLVSSVGPAVPRTVPGGPERCVINGEWTQPVLAPVVSGFRTAGRPGHDGVDLGASRGTPIRAASAGTVMVVRCNVTPASWGCDRDGSPSTPGCGWYVDIRHAGNIITRYCHMLTRPSVAEGQHVLTGQVIGTVGSSGHSSGPHLHFEVHVDGDRTSAGAVDPARWMLDHGAPIGRSFNVASDATEER